MLRYRETGELHKDFHGGMNAAVEYVGRRYGREGLYAVFSNTAQKVYRSIYEKLKAGDWSELLEHWQYFMEREGADFSVEVTDDEAVMTVRRCPAVARLRELGMTPSEFFCDQTVLLNEAWCEGTPFEAVTEIKGEGCCVQRIRLLRPPSGCACRTGFGKATPELGGRNDECKKDDGDNGATGSRCSREGGRNDESKKEGGDNGTAVTQCSREGGRNDESKKEGSHDSE